MGVSITKRLYIVEPITAAHRCGAQRTEQWADCLQGLRERYRSHGAALDEEKIADTTGAGEGQELY